MTCGFPFERTIVSIARRWRHPAPHLRLRRGLLQKFVWEIDFSLAIARRVRSALADTFPVRPAMLRSRIEKAFTLLAADRLQIEEAIAVLEELKRETEALAPL